MHPLPFISPDNQKFTAQCVHKTFFALHIHIDANMLAIITRIQNFDQFVFTRKGGIIKDKWYGHVLQVDGEYEN
jgi:hypothetical protein